LIFRFELIHRAEVVLKFQISILMIALTLWGCSNQGAYPLDASIGSAPAGQAVAGDVKPEFPLSISDKVRITVYNEPSLTGEYSVGANGMIAFPLIGNVKAVGLSSAALTDELRAKLADGFVRNPSVSVDVLTFRPFYVLGEVNRAGVFPFSAGMSVMQAIAAAQGFSYRANKNYVFIKRAGSDREEKVAITPTLSVQPGDTIRVVERYF
jgi:protein involved in polysaccharide export with SLBB domain